MRLSQERLLVLENSTGFRADILEKVIHLLNLLNSLVKHPYLKGKFALKGGTALNLFFFDMPRLSVDIDLNYIGSLTGEEMTNARPRIDQAIQAVFSREGFTIKRMPEEHAGGKWRLGYVSAFSQTRRIEIDFNFMFRQPLWDVHLLDSHALGDFQAIGIPVLDLNELAAGKMAALFVRRQARDLFDVRQLMSRTDIDRKQLRIAFVVYGAMNSKDWRAISLDDIQSKTEEMNRSPLPFLRRDIAPLPRESSDYFRRLMTECREYLSIVFPFEEHELEFLNLILDKGEIDSSLLTNNRETQQRIRNHPMLLWKGLNVRKHLSLGT